MPRFIALIPILALCFVTRARAQDPLKTLRPAHPRLILLDSDIPAIKATIASDPFAAANFAELQRAGNDMLTKPPRHYVLDGSEHDMLNTARAVESVVLTCAGLYRLTGQRKYADRAIAEMYAAAAFPDWNPTHFLDTAELTAALGLGYDWLYPILTPDQRKVIHATIVDKGLNPWIEITAGGKPPAPLKPFHMLNNWTQVCTGGMTIGALALADEEPARARQVLNDAQTRILTVMKFFAPDGGFDEGPVYWSYATSYNVLYLAALDSALGNDFGASQMPGFSDTGNYRIQVLGPTFKPANYGDAHDEIYRAPQMFWMATKFNKPDYAVAERRIDEAFLASQRRTDGLSDRFLIFFPTFYRTPPATAPDPPAVATFRHSDLAFLRSDWSLADGKADTNAFFIGLKGGLAMTNHGHLDMGSFVLDALGQRWAIDLGPDSYGLPNYNNIKNPDRWTYFRDGAFSHNTLTVNNANIDTTADAHLIAAGHASTGFPKFAVLDLDSAYAAQLQHWQRGAEILDSSRILLQDEFTPNDNADVLWHMLTHADASEKSGDVILSQGGKKLRMHILSPTGAQFTTRSVPSPPKPQEPFSGVNEVSIHLSKVGTAQTIAIVFSADDDKLPVPVLEPLSQWSTKVPQ